MQGLRTQENEKFKRFFSIVQSEAARQGKIFFCDAGDGTNLFEDDSLECEDLMGWLIPQEDVAVFEPDWKKGDVPDQWTDSFTFAVWRRENEKVMVEFKTYES